MAKKVKKAAKKVAMKRKAKKAMPKAAKSMAASKRQISLRLDLGEHKRLTIAANKKGLSINGFIKMVLKEKKAA